MIMNKRFSTLVAGLLLASSIGTVNADVIGGDFAQYSTMPGKAMLIKKQTYYQLAADDKGSVVAMIPNKVDGEYDGTYSLKVVGITSEEDVRYTLWTIDVQGNPTDGYRYSFLNKGTNMILSVNPATALKATNSNAVSSLLGGNISVWKWQDAPDLKGGFDLSNGQEVLTSVFGAENDSTVTLVANDNNVYAVKYALNNKAAANLGKSQLKVVPAKPEAVVLGVDDLNSMLWSTTADGKLTLTFDKDVEGGNPAAVNLFTKQAYKAVKPVGFPANFTYAGQSGKAAYPDASTELTAEYGKMTSAEYDYAEAAAVEVFDKAIQALMPKATFADNHTAVWAAKNAIATISTWATQTDKGEIVKLIDAIDLDDVKAVKDVTGLDQVKDEVLGSALVGVKAAMINLIYAHPGESYQIKTDDVQYAAMGASVAFDRLDKIVRGDTFDGVEAVVKASVKDAEEKKEALDKVMADAKDVFETEAGKAGWVSLQANYGESGEASYLAVDTAFLTSQAGDKHLAMAIKNFKDKNVRPNNEDRTRLDLNGRFNFQFVWHPASDSIVIRTAGFAKKADKTPYWSMMNKTDNPLDLGMWRANEAAKETSNGTKVNITAENKPFEQNLIKIAVLANNHREVTVGSSEYTSVDNDPVSTINTKITIGNRGLYKKTTIAAGIYYFNLTSNLPWRSVENGKYSVAQFCGNYTEFAKPEVDQTYGVAQNYEHMPRTQWVIEQNAGPVASERTVNIYNREFPNLKAENVQLYDGGNGTVFALFGNYDVPFAQNDTVSYKPVVDPAAAAHGYMVLDEEELLKYSFTMDHYSGYGIGHKVNVSAIEKDSVIFVNAKEDADGVRLQLVEVKDVEKYGYKDQLKKKAYYIRVYDSSKLQNNNKWVVADYGNEKSWVLSDESASIFYLKANNELTVDGETKCYYALVSNTGYRVGVRDGSLEFSIESACSETRVATFYLDVDNTPYYRRLGETNKEDGFVDMKTANAKIFDALTGEYLYEDNNSDYSKGKGIHFLGIENKKVNVKNPTLYVDTAYVRGETMMPQYMLAVGVVEHKGKMECPIDPEHNSDEYLTAHPDGCPHAVATQDYKVGRYLISFSDSVALAKNSKDYLYDRAYTRLGFVEAKHIGDTLVIYRNGVPGTATADSIFLGDNKPNKRTWALNADPSKNTKVDSIHAAHKYGIKNAVFAFRLVDDEPEANFLIESTVEEPKATWGGWIKNQNGVPVIAHYENYNEAALDALVFNIETSSEEATANEGIATSEVKVLAGEGRVTIAGAAGKKVVITNILGQVVANTVIVSDNAVIAAPQGVVVVAVEGEEAVKAIVK